MSLETKLSFIFRNALGECLTIHVSVKTVYAVHSKAPEVTTLPYCWEFTHSVQSSSTEWESSLDQRVVMATDVLESWTEAKQLDLWDLDPWSRQLGSPKGSFRSELRSRFEGYKQVRYYTVKKLKALCSYPDASKNTATTSRPTHRTKEFTHSNTK